MSNFLSLIQKIGHFYKASTNSYLKALGADESDDDLGLYPEMVDAARMVSDADVADQILLIAAMYKKTLEVNGGYTLVRQGIDNLLNMLQMEDEDEQSSVEDLLNKVSQDLGNRASTAPAKDDEAVMAALKRVRDQHYNPIIEGLESDLEPGASPYEASLEQYQEGATGVFDPTGGVSQEVGKSKGRGYHVETRTFKDWSQSYENERQRFEHALTDPELLLSKTWREARKNTAARSNLKELVDTLGQMVTLTKQATELEADLQAAPDPNKQQKLNEIRGVLKQLQDRRAGLKKNLRTYQYAQQNKSLAEDMTTARTDKEKFLIQQRMRLNDLMSSPDKGKDEESKWLRVLINSMSEGRSIPPEQIAKIEQKIREGASSKVKATTLWRQRAEEVAKIKGTPGAITERQVGEEGKSVKRHKYNLDIVKLDGLLVHLQQRLATERVVVKQNVTDKMKKAKLDQSLLKPYIDDLAKAVTKKDRNAFVTAAATLREKMKEFKNMLPEVRTFAASAKYSKFFYDFRDKGRQINEWMKSGEPFTPEQVSFIDDTIREGKKLLAYDWKKLPALGGGFGERKTYYGPPLEIIDKIVKNLEDAKYG